jgi:hypothetical protein
MRAPHILLFLDGVPLIASKNFEKIFFDEGSLVPSGIDTAADCGSDGAAPVLEKQGRS